MPKPSLSECPVTSSNRAAFSSAGRVLNEFSVILMGLQGVMARAVCRPRHTRTFSKRYTVVHHRGGLSENGPLLYSCDAGCALCAPGCILGCKAEMSEVFLNRILRELSGVRCAASGAVVCAASYDAVPVSNLENKLYDLAR